MISFYFILISGELAQCLINPPDPLELPVAEQQELGYMPYRDDFERVDIFEYFLHLHSHSTFLL